MELTVLAFGFLGVGAPEFPEDRLAQRLWHEEAVQEFEKQGVEFAEGYLAGRHEGAPQWFVRFIVWSNLESPRAKAARDMLRRRGINSDSGKAFGRMLLEPWRECYAKAKEEVKKTRPRFFGFWKRSAPAT